jgi:ADP-glucose pyrophosphorylase
MDYMQFVDYHRTSGADITIGCIAYDQSRASDFGLMKVCLMRAGGWACEGGCLWG